MQPKSIPGTPDPRSQVDRVDRIPDPDNLEIQQGFPSIFQICSVGLGNFLKNFIYCRTAVCANKATRVPSTYRQTKGSTDNCSYLMPRICHANVETCCPKSFRPTEILHQYIFTVSKCRQNENATKLQNFIRATLSSLLTQLLNYRGKGRSVKEN